MRRMKALARTRRCASSPEFGQFTDAISADIYNKSLPICFGHWHEKGFSLIDIGLYYKVVDKLDINFTSTLSDFSFKNSEYDQKTPQSQTADPVALRRRATQPLRYIRKANKAK